MLPAAAAPARWRVPFRAVSSVMVSRTAFVRSSISLVMLCSSVTMGEPARFHCSGTSSSDPSVSNSWITSSSVVRPTFPANRYPPPTPRTAWTSPAWTRFLITFARWWAEMPYFSAISVVESCRSASLASSSTATRAYRLPLFSFTARSRPSFDLLLELDVTARAQAEAPEERQRQLVVPVHHRPNRGDAGGFQTPADLLEHALPDPLAPHVLGHGQREHPAARGGAELPRPDLAADESDDLAAGLRDQEQPVLLAAPHVMLEDPAPVGRFLFLRPHVIQRDDRVDVGRQGVPDGD